MPTAFELISEDFSGQLSTLRRLIDKAYAPGPSIDADLRLATSNAAVLLLASTFEEFLRQLIRAYTEHLVTNASTFGDLPDTLRTAIWERALYKLKSAKYGTRLFDRPLAELSVRQITTFCLEEKLSVPVSDLIAYNENNTKTVELNSMFKRVGISDYCGIVGRRSELVDFFGAADGNRAHASFTSALDAFYDARNSIAHSIGSHMGSGQSEILRNIDLFHIVSDVMSDDLGTRVSFA